ncbi:MAG TPA: class I SAM-dependent methyltransferase [Patescibacteria group bacterium]|nr:class I SAM-dependent methyltransferase [Patescibacteria group bacterium]
MCTTASKSGFSSWLSRTFYPWALQHNTAYERFMAERKQQLFKDISGTVVEIGAGTGANFPYFPVGIDYIAIEPHEQLRGILKAGVKKHNFKSAEILEASAENIPLDSSSADIVISTLVLCSVSDVSTVLQEIKRVLKPGGRLLFIEHVAAHHGTLLLKVQRFVKPAWRKIVDNCHPDRRTGESLKSAGFKNVEFEEFRVPVPVVAPHIAGFAVK